VSGGPGFNTAFVRFDWAATFRAATGVSDAMQIAGAAIRLEPDFGDSQTIQVRRCLQRWSDPASGGDFNSNPTGGPTWNACARGIRNWNLVGAGRLGSNGTSTNDYFGTNDLAARVDTSAAMLAINEPTEFAGPFVTDAFRFWFANPGVDYGYALRLAPGAKQETKFARWESGLRADGPVLRLTYLLPGAGPTLSVRRNFSSLLLTWAAEPSNFSLQSAPAPEGPWTPVLGAPAPNNGTNTLGILTNLLGPTQYFRLATP
jgi:hypothetical protein